MPLRNQGLLKNTQLPLFQLHAIVSQKFCKSLQFNSPWNMLCIHGRLCPDCFLNLTYSPPDIHRHSPTLPSSLCSNVTVSVTLYLRLQIIFPSSIFFPIALSIISSSYLIYLMSFSSQLECKLHQSRTLYFGYKTDMQQMPLTCAMNK